MACLECYWTAELKRREFGKAAWMTTLLPVINSHSDLVKLFCRNVTAECIGRSWSTPMLPTPPKKAPLIPGLSMG